MCKQEEQFNAALNEYHSQIKAAEKELEELHHEASDFVVQFRDASNADIAILDEKIRLLHAERESVCVNVLYSFSLNCLQIIMQGEEATKELNNLAQEYKALTAIPADKTPATTEAQKNEPLVAIPEDGRPAVKQDSVLSDLVMMLWLTVTEKTPGDSAPRK